MSIRNSLAMLTALSILLLSSAAGADTEFRPTKTNGARPRDVMFSIFGGGAFVSDLFNVSNSSKVKGSVGAQILFPSNVYVALTFDATSDVKPVVQGIERKEFGASILNTSLGPYSFSGDLKLNELFNIVGAYGYLRISTAAWQFAESDEQAEETGAVAYDAVPYNLGLGVLFSRRFFPQDLKGNSLYLDSGVGVALRGVGGDICQGDRLVQFIGTDSCVFLGPELKTLLEFNAIRASFSLFLFPQRGVDGLSGVRFLIGIGAAGDFIKVN